MKKLVVAIAVMLAIAGAVSAVLLHSGVVKEMEPPKAEEPQTVETETETEQAEEPEQARAWIRLNRGAVISRKFNDTWIVTVGPILNVNNVSTTVTGVAGNVSLAWVEVDGVERMLPAEIMPLEVFTVYLELTEALGYESAMTVDFTILTTRQDFPVLWVDLV